MQIIVDGIDTEYIDCGTGPTVLFLHGWGANATSFYLLKKELENNKRYLSLSLPSFGQTENPPSSWSVADYARFVENFLLKLNILRLDLIVAHSFGGRIAIKGIASGRLLPKQLVLIASAGVARHTIRQNILIVLLAVVKPITFIPPILFVRPWIQRFFKLHVGSLDYQKAEDLQGTFKKVIAENLTEDAKRIKLPTLLIWGDGDIETPISEAYTLLDCINDSNIKILPGAGHFVFNEKVKQVAKLIQEFYV
jgi:pimeloyl-ACP methyl ester carboxylesterase